MPDHQLIGKDEIGPMHKHHKQRAVVWYGELPWCICQQSCAYLLLHRVSFAAQCGVDHV